MNLIQQEQDCSRKYYLDTTKTKEGNDIVILSRKNVALVEAMIRHDSDYSNTGNIKNQTSSAFWLHELKNTLVDGAKGPYSYSHILENCVNYIDSENSTRLNADMVGRKQMRERLESIDRLKLIEYLQSPKKENYKLVEILSQKTKIEINDKKHHARANLSFATKFCHYACYYLFDGMPEQDNFSIYDGIVSKHIPDYARFLNVKLPKNYKSDYNSYISLVDAIIAKTNEPISRNGFDHLLWYYHKAR